MSASDDIADAHQWRGGYFCTCGHELNSPRGFTAHVLEVAKSEARDEVTRLDGELTGVRASLVEQAQDAEDARATVAMRTGQLRKAQAERDAALAVVGRVARLPQEWRDADEWTRCTCGNCCADDLTAALAGTQEPSGVADETVAVREPNGVQIDAQRLADAAGRARVAAEKRRGGR